MLHRKVASFALLVRAMGLAVLLCGVARRVHAEEPATPSYRLLDKIAIGGEGGWDYLTVDSAAHRLYVTRGTHVVVIDTRKNAVVGDISNTPGVHGVALAPKLGRGYTSNGRENTVTVFDLKTLKELQRIAVGQNPDAILFDPYTNRVFTFNAISKDSTVLDAVSGRVLGTIPLGGKPEFCVTDDRGTLFVNIEDTGEIVVLDSQALKVKSRWSLAPVTDLTGLAFDKAHHLLFSTGDEKMAVVDSLSGKLLATPPIGKGADAAVFDAAFGLAISSNGEDGTLTLVRQDSKKTFTAVGTVATQAGARTMILDPKTHRLYLITATFRPLAPGEPAQRLPPTVPNSAVILVYGIDK